jgi:hypothetical protein
VGLAVFGRAGGRRAKPAAWRGAALELKAVLPREDFSITQTPRMPQPLSMQAISGV